MKKKQLLILLGVLVVVAVAVVVFIVMRPTNAGTGEKLIEVTTPEETVFCPLETKICPDGNIVIRNNEDGCEFYECPVDVTNTSTTTPE